MISAIVAVVIFALVITLVVIFAREPGPTPTDIAISYELAWDRLDFESLFTLSGTELRDGLDRRGFVVAKRAAYAQQHALRGLVERVDVDQVANTRDAAVAITEVELHDRAVVHNRVEMVRRNGRWQVVAYQLEPPAADAAPADG